MIKYRAWLLFLVKPVCFAHTNVIAGEGPVRFLGMSTMLKSFGRRIA